MEFDKSKIYTAASADEVKIGSKGYFADNLMDLKSVVEEEYNLSEITTVGGEYFQSRFRTGSGVYSLFYLVEEPKEKKLRPYRDTDEMIEDFKKRFNVNVPPCAMPLIWIKAKDADKKYLIVRFASALTICLNVEVFTPTFEELAEDYTYLDGSPCGVEE